MALSKITNSGIGAIDTLAVDTDTLVVDSTNNRVGIGTSSPTDELHVVAAGASSTTDITIENTNASGQGCALRLKQANTNANSKMVFDDGGTESGFVFDGGANSVLHYANGTERMRIDSNGNVAINGSVRDSSRFTINGNVSNPNLQSWQNTTSGVTHFWFRNPNGIVGSVVTSGSSTAYNTSSDYRLKENVVADWDATTRLKQLNPVRFNFISDADTTVDGFLAHEVQSVVPEAITGTHDEVDDEGNPVYQGIDQSKLVPLLVKTIQELEARIVALETA